MKFAPFEIVEVFQSNDQGCPSTCSRTASTKNWSFRTVRIILLRQKHALQVEELTTYFDETPQMDVVEESYDRLPIKSLSELAVDGKILLEESGKNLVSGLVKLCNQLKKLS